MVSGCVTLNLAMISRIAYIILESEDRTIFGKDNAMADILSRARFDNEDDMVSEVEEVGEDYFESGRMSTKKMKHSSPHQVQQE